MRKAIQHLLAPAALILAACSSGPKPNWKSIRRYIHETYPEVKSTTTKALFERMQKDERPLILLDVRQLEEFQVSHLKGAILVESRSDIAKRLKELRDPENPGDIVVYCSVGVRSANLAQQLSKDGILGVANLDGSIFEWANRGYPLVRMEAKTTQAHPYNKEWGKLLKRELWDWGTDQKD